jgi:hypothetical protein
MKPRFCAVLIFALLLSALALPVSAAAPPTYDINTLAGKVASVNGTAGLQIRFSALIEQEAAIELPNLTPLHPLRPLLCCQVRWMAAPLLHRRLQ